MTWNLTPYGKSRRGLPGVNWRDLSDEEYEAALAANPGMDQRGYFEHVEDEPYRPPKAKGILAKDGEMVTTGDAVETAEETTDG